MINPDFHLSLRVCLFLYSIQLIIGCSSDSVDSNSMMITSTGEMMDLQGGSSIDMMEGQDNPVRSGIGVLGYSSHSIDEVDVEIIGVKQDGLRRPTALEVNPARPNELWVVNHRDDSVVVFFDFKTSERRSRKFTDPYALHFMNLPTSISFGPDGLFATCQDSNNGGDYFMGPTLWTSDFDIFAQSNPDAIAFLSENLGSHLDMLHESPYCMGIAWQDANQYWVFEGQTSSIAKVDFNEDHGPGFDDHSDGVTWRYAVGEVSRMAGFPSHFLYDHETQRLYIADTGNQRVGVLDTTQEGDRVTSVPSKEEGTLLLIVENGPQVETLVQQDDAFRGPTGLAMHDGILYVSDTAKGRITAVDPMTGEILDWLDTGISSPGLMGITFDDEGNLYVADGLDDRILRFSAKP